jgi:tetratricopeptide (TPR) repeat protein
VSRRRPQPQGGATRAAQLLVRIVQRTGLLAAGTAACLLAIAAFAAAVSSLYASTVDDLMRHAGRRVDTVAAARFAVRLAPWRSANRFQLARSLAAAGAIDEAIAQAAAALHANPADGYTWVYAARLLAERSGEAPRLVGYYAMAAQRTPNAPHLQLAIALDGVHRWQSGDSALHAIWRSSMAYSLEHQRTLFLQEIVRQGRDPQWCAAQRGHLPVEAWCARAQRIRRDCATPNLAPRAAEWCRRFGILPPA